MTLSVTRPDGTEVWINIESMEELKDDNVQGIINALMGTPVQVQPEPETKPKEKPKQTKKKKKLDHGKMKALRDAGWAYQDIADEVGCSVGTAHRILNEAEK